MASTEGVQPFNRRKVDIRYPAPTKEPSVYFDLEKSSLILTWFAFTARQFLQSQAFLVS